MKRFLALALSALMVLCCGLPAAAAPTQLTDFDQAYLDSLAAKEQALKDKLDACTLAGIPADYETVNYNVFRRYSQVLRDELRRASFTLEEALYYDRCLGEIYDEAAASLDALLRGDKIGEYVPRYITGPVVINGQSVRGKTRAGDVVEEGRPIFFTGFCGWGDAGANSPTWPGLGLNIVGQEIGPSSFIKPPAPDSEGEFSVNPTAAQRIKDVLAAAEENNVWVDLLLSPHYFPDFLLEKYPELRVDSGPHAFIKYDLAAPLAREVMSAFLRALLPEIKDYPSLHSLCLANEPVFHSWQSETHLVPWREFLRDRYGDIAALNSNCRTTYDSFDDIPFPEMKASPLMVDFIDYNDKVMDGFNLLMIEEIRKVLPDIPIHTKTMDYYSTGKWKDTYDERVFLRGIDHEKIAGYTQLNGNDAWRTLQREWQDPLDQAFDPVRYNSKSMWYDLLRSANGAPVYNSEDHLSIDDDARLLPEFRPFLISDLWQGAVHGRTLSTAWVWEFGGPEAFTLYHSVGWRLDLVAAMGRTNLDLNRLAYEVTALQHARADVAVLYSKSSRVFDYTNVAETMYDAYQYASLSGQRVDFVTENDIAEKLGNYKLLILPKASRLPQASIEAVKAFQKSGGAVVVVGLDSLWFDEYNHMRGPLNMLPIYFKAKKVMPSLNLFGFSLAFAKGLQQRAFQKVLDKQGLYNVALTDVKTGKPVIETEWFGTEFDGRTIINMCNFDWNNTPTVKISIGGRDCGAMVDLITGEAFHGTVALKPYEPRLIQVG